MSASIFAIMAVIVALILTGGYAFKTEPACCLALA